MKQESPRLQPWGVSREIPERQPDRPGRGHHRPDRPRRPPRRHHQTEMGLSNGLCSNHVGRSQSSRTHSSGAAAQIERPEVGTIACGHRVHDRVLGAGLVAVVPRPIRFGRIFSDGLIESRRKTTGFSRGEEVNCLNRGSSDRPNLATAATGNGRWNGTAGTACSSSAG